IVTSLIVSIIPLAIAGHIAGLALRQALVNAANVSLAGAAAHTAARVDGFIQTNLDTVRTEAQLLDFGEFLDLSFRQPATGGEYAIKAGHVAAMLRALSRRDQLYILSYALLDVHGTNVMSTNHSEAGGDQSRHDYFQKPIATGLPYVSAVEFSEAADPPSIYFSAPIRNEQGITVGVLRIRYNAAILQDIVADANGLAGPESYAILLDENHLRLADGESPDSILKTVVPLDPAKVAELRAADRLPRRPVDQLSTNLPAFEQGLTDIAAQPFFRAELEAAGKTLEAVAVAPMTTAPWLVAFGQEEAVFLAPVEMQTRNSLLGGAITMAVVVLTIAVGAQRVAGPIVRLTAVAEKVGAGDLSVQARVEANDETGVLAATFNSMIVQLRQTLDGLAERSAELRRANDRLQAELAERQQAEVALRESEAKYRTLVNEVSDGFYVSDLTGTLTFANRALARILGVERPEALVGRSFLEFVPSAKVGELAGRYQAAMAAGKGTQVIDTEVIRRDGARAFIEIRPQVIVEAGRPMGNRGTLRDVTERKNSEDEIKRRLAELEAVNRLSTAMRSAHTQDEMLPVVLDVTLGVLQAAQGAVWLHDPVKDELRTVVMRGWGEQTDVSRIPPEKPGEGVAGIVFASGQPYVAGDFHLDLRLPENVRQWIPPGMGGAAIPIRAADKVIGVFIANAMLPRELTPSEVHLLTILGEIAGNAIQRTTLHEQTEQRLQRLDGLHQIDTVINASLDLHLTLNVFVDQVITQLRVDAAAVILLNR
ncbi:MAG: PAS domain S-box protein, partial [Chloroflexi bacterium]|nr:PAS domain S-box protein [Chloroflexota bacterium]